MGKHLGTVKEGIYSFREVLWVLTCFSVKIKRIISKTMSSIWQQREHHHQKMLIESFHFSEQSFRDRWPVQELVLV